MCTTVLSAMVGAQSGLPSASSFTPISYTMEAAATDTNDIELLLNVAQLKYLIRNVHSTAAFLRYTLELESLSAATGHLSTFISRSFERDWNRSTLHIDVEN
jgi:hypothetical protein